MIPAHPLAELFPMLGDADAASLAADIGANGMHDRIVVLDGQILDGRNRHRAAIAAGLLSGDLPPDGDALWMSHFRRFVPAQDGDPLAWVLSKNLHRRHLSEGQRAMVAAKIANLGTGQRASSSANLQSSPPVTQPQAAELLHVSPRSVASAVAVREHGAPGLAERVESGEVAVSLAAEVAKLSVGDQIRLLQEADPRAFRSVVAEKRAELTQQKKQRREERVTELGARQAALPDKRYGLILADPEWEHAAWSDGGMHKAAANIYPVSSLETLKERDVPSIAADDCVLFMWTTVPHLEQAFEVMRAWGFTYSSSAVWHKQYPGARQGMGYWFRINHEILLVGTRGNIPAPAPGTQFGSVIVAPIGAHSEKPVIVHEMIEALYGALPKIELNARVRRPGWDVWGLEAPDEAHPQSTVDADLEAEERAIVSSVSAAIATDKATALPIIAARYTGDNAQQLADELGRPINTIRKWAFELGKTDAARNVARIQDINRERAQ